MLALFCAMCGVFVLSAMLPNYLVDYLKLSGEQMGFVMSGLGFGGFIGQFALPGLSDILGRRIVAVTGFALTAGLIWVLTQTGANPTLLFGLLFLISMGCLGLVALITGPISTESAPVGLVSSAIGIVVGAGEIFGGGVAPSFAGFIAQHYGIQKRAVSGAGRSSVRDCGVRIPAGDGTAQDEHTRQSEAAVAGVLTLC